MHNFVYSSLQSANIMQLAKAKMSESEVFKGHFLRIYTVKITWFRGYVCNMVISVSARSIILSIAHFKVLLLEVHRLSLGYLV